MPEKHTKTIYQRVMSNFKLKDHWTDTHTRAFLDLKAAMTSEPVLKGPKWDGTPFIVTTDGCKVELKGPVLRTACGPETGLNWTEMDWTFGPGPCF